MALERRTVFFMSLACAINVANMYYCQPLLSAMGQSLGVPDSAIGYLPMWTQAGTALGMFCFVPLGDLFPRRPLIIVMTLAGALSVLFMAMAPGLTMVNVAGFLTGLTAIVSHLILPYAAKLADPERRGQVLGTVLAGLLLGILLARVVSGYVGDMFGWRTVYWFSAAAAVASAIGIWVAFPPDRPEAPIGYGELLGSIVRLVRTLPELREAAITGGMLFGAFSSFWATLVFFLGFPPYHYGPRVAGLFGAVGAVGVLIAPRAGRLSDRRGAAFTVAAGIGVTIFSFLVFLAAGKTMVGLVVGVILMDLGVQAGHVANQTRIYGLMPEARSRLNTVYMVTYFIGGALGSALGGFGWTHWGWQGVCAAGLLQLLVALGFSMNGRVRQRKVVSPAPVAV